MFKIITGFATTRSCVHINHVAMTQGKVESLVQSQMPCVHTYSDESDYFLMGMTSSELIVLLVNMSTLRS